MSPIEQVRPTLPGNWTRRPEPRIKRDGGRRPERKPGDAPGRDHDGTGEGPRPPDHIVDELA